MKSAAAYLVVGCLYLLVLLPRLVMDTGRFPHPRSYLMDFRLASPARLVGDALLNLLSKGSLPGLQFRSTDLDALFEKVRASGAEVLQEPIAQPWGARDCAFRDPSGNLIRIAQA